MLNKIKQKLHFSNKVNGFQNFKRFPTDFFKDSIICKLTESAPEFIKLDFILHRIEPNSDTLTLLNFIEILKEIKLF